MPNQKWLQLVTHTTRLLVYTSISLALSSRVAAQSLNIFKNGETADADEINANFSLLDSQLKDLESRLSPGFDGSTQSIVVDCTSDSSALETAMAGVSSNAVLALYVSGHCSVSSVRADRGQTIYVIGSDPAQDKLVAHDASWAPVFSHGYMYLANIGVVQSAGNRSGAYAWSGGHLALINVTIETPNSGEGAADSFFCVAAELGSTAYISGLTCSSYSKGIGLIGASSAWLRGKVNVTASGGSAISASDSSAFMADRVKLTALGFPAFNLHGSTYRQQYGDASTTYNITGDINLMGGSVLYFDDPEQTNHFQPGVVSVTDSTVSLKGFTTANYVLERSTGSIVPHRSVSNLKVDAKQSDFQLEADEATSTTVDLRNSTMHWSRDCQPVESCFVNTFLECRGNSNLEINGEYYTGNKCLTILS